MGAWTGVDLDGTLAVYKGWKGPTHIGEPIPKMVDRVVQWISEGKLVKIMTARVCPDGRGNPYEVQQCEKAIQAWCQKHIIPKLPLHLREPWPIEIPVTYKKDFEMVELWDDRAVQVEMNTGRRIDGQEHDLSNPADRWNYALNDAKRVYFDEAGYSTTEFIEYVKSVYDAETEKWQKQGR